MFVSGIVTLSLAVHADEGQVRRDAERARIAAERANADAAFSASEVACYRRFAVNDCLRDAQTKRRATLADLRRQEISLNDEERKLRAAQQRQRLDERAAQQDDRQQRAQQRALTPPAAPVASGAARQHAPRARPPQTDKSAAPPLSAAEQARARADYEKRQREAQQRKARVLERIENNRPAAQPLPVPP